MQIANCSIGGRQICNFQFSFLIFDAFTDCKFPARPAAAFSNDGESTATDQDNAERSLQRFGCTAGLGALHPLLHFQYVRLTTADRLSARSGPALRPTAQTLAAQPRRFAAQVSRP